MSNILNFISRVAKLLILVFCYDLCERINSNFLPVTPGNAFVLATAFAQIHIVSEIGLTTSRSLQHLMINSALHCNAIFLIYELL